MCIGERHGRVDVDVAAVVLTQLAEQNRNPPVGGNDRGLAGSLARTQTAVVVLGGDELAQRVARLVS